MSRFAVLLMLAFAPAVLAGDSTPQTRKVQVTLQRLDAGQWATVDPQLVLKHGDRVRFRVTTNFDAFVYVVNYGTSGHSATLYPGSGDDNRLVHGRVHAVPAESSDLRISRTAGQDIVYWIFSSTPLHEGERTPLRDEGKPGAVLIPRCDDALLRARGECLDSTAGARDLDLGHVNKPPTTDNPAEADKAADLTFLREEKSSVIAAGGNAPMIYEFRISHQ